MDNPQNLEPYPPFQPPIPLEICQRLKPLVDQPALYSALLDYCKALESNITHNLSELNIKSGVETLALEAAGFRALIRQLQGFSVLKEVVDEILEHYRDYMHARDEHNRQAEATPQWRAPNRVDMAESEE